MNSAEVSYRMETPIYFSGLPWFCCYLTGATVGVCSTTELPAEDFQSEPFTEGNTALERTPVCLVWKCVILSVPCVPWLSACGQEGSSSGSRRGNMLERMVWCGSGLVQERNSLLGSGLQHARAGETPVLHIAGAKQTNARADASLAATVLHTERV